MVVSLRPAGPPRKRIATKSLILELKAVAKLEPINEAQLLTYLIFLSSLCSLCLCG